MTFVLYIIRHMYYEVTILIASLTNWFPDLGIKKKQYLCWKVFKLVMTCIRDTYIPNSKNVEDNIVIE
jgi:hypothetical protein